MMGQKRFTRTNAQLLTGHAGRPGLAGRRSRAWIIGLLVVLLAGDSAFADFLVQPMLLRLTVQPGRGYNREMKLENSDPTEGETLTLRLAELTQREDASWREFRPEDPNFKDAVVRSCASWLTLPPGEIRVGPYQIVPFNLQINVPAQTQGFYFAAIVATTAPRVMTLPNGTLAPVNMQLVVPIILEVQSTPMQHRIALTGVDLQYQAKTLETPAANDMFLDIANNGGTFSRLLPVVRLSNEVGGHWRRLMEVKYPELAIMPGAKLHIKAELPQALPSGKYHAEAFLFVDGRRGDLIRKIIDYAGDPTLAPTVKGQVALRVDPEELIVDMIPGTARTRPLQILNGSEEQVNVTAELVVPEHMHATTTGLGVNGDDLSCADWVTLNPPKFQLRGHAQRSITIIAKTPKEATRFRDYYGTLKLHSFFLDGTPAGTKEALVCVQNPRVTDRTIVEGVVLTVSETSPSRYWTTAQFTNKGNIHVNDLSCLGYLNLMGVAGGGASTVKRFLMSSEANGQTGILLPIESRSYSGVLDVSDVADGRYFLTAILRWPGDTGDGIQKQIPIEVKGQGGSKKIILLDPLGVPMQTIKL